MLDGERIIAVVEMKARCTGVSASREKERIDEVGRFAGVPWNSSLLQKYVLKRSEAVQVGQVLILGVTNLHETTLTVATFCLCISHFQCAHHTSTATVSYIMAEC